MPSDVKLPILFNSTAEVGCRYLFILAALGTSESADRLLVLDYFLLHSGDFEGGPVSLHPAVPFRSGEWIARRRNSSSILDALVARELINKLYTAEGVMFVATQLTTLFLETLTSGYAKELSVRAKWVSSKFLNVASDELSKLMYERLDSWRNEDLDEAYFREPLE